MCFSNCGRLCIKAGRGIYLHTVQYGKRLKTSKSMILNWEITLSDSESRFLTWCWNTFFVSYMMTTFITDYDCYLVFIFFSVLFLISYPLRRVEFLHLFISVCFSARHLKTDAARSIKLDIFHNESWKPIYFGVKRSGFWVTKHCRRGSLHSNECWLLVNSVYYCV